MRKIYRYVHIPAAAGNELTENDEGRPDNVALRHAAAVLLLNRDIENHVFHLIRWSHQPSGDGVESEERFGGLIFIAVNTVNDLQPVIYDIYAISDGSW
jgi:hypothetical protein